MIDHVWTVICSRSVIDRDSNNISLHNVLEQITIAQEVDPEQVAVIPTKFEVVTLWARSDFDEPAEGEQRLTLIAPSGETLVTGEAKIDLSEFRRTRYRAKFEGLPTKGRGRYVFRIECRTNGNAAWSQAADIPLELMVNPQLREKPENEGEAR
jgi:hypothetical protein